ncbi:hypothetical protein Tco_1233122 [Tanacetum coccineum]
MSARISHPVNINQSVSCPCTYFIIIISHKGMTQTCSLAALGYPDEMCMAEAVGSGFVYTDFRQREVLEIAYDPMADTQ